MIQTLWIYSAGNNWFTNGKHRITVEISHQRPFDFVRDWYYEETGLVLHREDLEIGTHRDLVIRLSSPWKPKTPEEVIRILDGK